MLKIISLSIIFLIFCHTLQAETTIKVNGIILKLTPSALKPLNTFIFDANPPIKIKSGDTVHLEIKTTNSDKDPLNLIISWGIEGEQLEYFKPTSANKLIESNFSHTYHLKGIIPLTISGFDKEENRFEYRLSINNDFPIH